MDVLFSECSSLSVFFSFFFLLLLFAVKVPSDILR